MNTTGTSTTLPKKNTDKTGTSTTLPKNMNKTGTSTTLPKNMNKTGTSTTLPKNMNKTGKSAKRVTFADTAVQKAESPPVKKNWSALKQERDRLLNQLFATNEYLSQLKQKNTATEESCVVHWQLLQDMEQKLKDERQLRQEREKELQRCRRLVKAKAKIVNEGLEEQTSMNRDMTIKLRLKAKLASKLQSQVVELSEQVTTLQASVQPVESTDQTEDFLVPKEEESENTTEEASVETKVSEPELSSEQQAVPEPSKKRKKRKRNKKAKEIPSSEEEETSESVSSPSAGQEVQDNVSLDHPKTEETDSPPVESVPEETVMESLENIVEEESVQVQDSDPVSVSEPEIKDSLPESLENLSEDSSVQVDVADPVSVSEQDQPLTAEPSRKRKILPEMDTTECPPNKKWRLCKPVTQKVRTRLAKRRDAINARHEQKTTDKTVIRVPWTFFGVTEYEIKDSLPEGLEDISEEVSAQKDTSETETIPEQDSLQEEDLKEPEPSDLENQDVDSLETLECSSQPEPPKKQKVSLWRRFKKTLTPARRRRYKSDASVVIPDQRSPDPAEEAEHVLQSTSVEDPDSDFSLTSASSDSRLTEDETSEGQDEEMSDDEEIASEDIEATDDEEITSEEETSDDEEDESAGESENTGGENISLWRRFKKALTPASKRQYK